MGAYVVYRFGQISHPDHGHGKRLQDNELANIPLMWGPTTERQATGWPDLGRTTKRSDTHGILLHIKPTSSNRLAVTSCATQGQQPPCRNRRHWPNNAYEQGGRPARHPGPDITGVDVELASRGRRDPQTG